MNTNGDGFAGDGESSSEKIYARQVMHIDSAPSFRFRIEAHRPNRQPRV